MALAGGLALSACGMQRQDANAPKGNYPVQVTAASFPAAQTLSQHTKMVIAVRNAGNRPIPNLAISVCPGTCSYPAPPGQGTSSAVFDSNVDQDSLNNPSQPVWVVETQPGPCGFSCQSGGGGTYATQNPDTWALGHPLAPGATGTFVWHVVAVRAGHQVVAWQVAADLYSQAHAVRPNDGGPVAGTFAAAVSSKPAQTYVNNNGQVVSGSGQP